MLDYSFNVFLLLKPYIAFTLLAVVAVVMLVYAFKKLAPQHMEKEVFDKWYKHALWLRAAVALLALLFSAFMFMSVALSPVVTPKNTVFDVRKDDAEVRRMAENEPKPAIEDRMRKNDLSKEEREKRFEEITKYK